MFGKASKEVLLSDYVWFQEGPGVRSKDFANNGVVLLTGKNINDNQISFGYNSDRFISEELANGKYNHFLCDKDDILVVSSAIEPKRFDSKVVTVNTDKEYCLNTGIIRFKPNLEFLTRSYFKEFLKSDYFKQQVSVNLAGICQMHFGPSHLKKMTLMLPDSIELQNEFENIVQQTDKSKFTEHFKSQFIEQFVLDKSHPREELKINIIEMFIGPFGSALKNDCFVEASDSYCMVYEQKHAIQKSMDLPTRYVDEKKYRELARFNIQPGDVIVSCRGTIGEVFVVPDDAPMGIMHPSIMKVRLNRKRYNNVFFAMLLEHYMEEHKQEANGTGVKMAVSASTLEKECFVIPEKSIQDAFVAFVKQSDKSKYVAFQETKFIENSLKYTYNHYFRRKNYVH